MSGVGARWAVAAVALLVLLPATGAFALVVLLSYPAYPPPSIDGWQLLFDAGVLVQLLAFASAWVLVVRRLWPGAATAGHAHARWLRPVGAGGLLGALGTAVALQHALRPDTAAPWVGYALWAPGLPLLAAWWALARTRPVART